MVALQCASLLLLSVAAVAGSSLDAEMLDAVLANVYTDSSAQQSQVYAETDEDKALLDANSVSIDTTYGEILPESVANISAQYADVERESSEFWDLGSGVGRMVMQEFLLDGWKKANGVEMVRRRYMYSYTALMKLATMYYRKGGEVNAWVRSRVGPGAELTESGPEGLGQKVCFGNKERELCLHNNDMMKVPGVERAGGIFMCSTCFPNSLLTAMMEQRFSKCKPGTVILSLKDLPEEDITPNGLARQQQVMQPMTWQQDVTVEVYKRTAPGTVKVEEVKVYQL